MRRKDNRRHYVTFILSDSIVLFILEINFTLDVYELNENYQI